MFMLSKNELKYYSSLLQKKYRNETGKFLVEGKKLILEAVNSDFECELIASTKHFSNDNPEFFDNTRIITVRHETIKQIELEKLSDTKTPQGVIGIFRKPSLKTSGKESKTIVALENISDPGNLGTIIRNCDWFGFSRVILSSDCAEIYSPKVIRSSAGSVFHISISEEKNFYDYLETLRKENYSIVCADLNGTDLYKFTVPKNFVIVFCNEANGPTSELLSICDSKLTIPRKGNAESLNVASASSVILYELARRSNL